MTETRTDDLWAGRVPRETGAIARGSLLLTVVALGGFLLWAVAAPIESASVAQGNFVATGRNRVVQHLEGGVIETLLVSEGDRVTRGDLLLRLDDAEARAELARLELRAFRLRATEARLGAEIAGREGFAIPDTLAAEAVGDPDRRAVLELQSSLFRARRETLEGEIAILEQGVAAYREHLGGAREQLASAETQLALMAEERATNETLMEKGLARRPALLAVQRAEAELEGERARLGAHIADGLERIVRGERLVANARHAALERAIGELDTAQAELQDVEERIEAARRALSRLAIRAPTSGIVVKLDVNTEGGVIRPGARIMELVPIDDELVIEARIRPQDIDSVRTGQPALVRLTAFNQRRTPMVEGSVVYVSADTLAGDRPGARDDAYVARIRLDRSSLEEAVANALTPGMPVEVYIRTGARTFAAYLLQPLTDSMTRAFRET